MSSASGYPHLEDALKDSLFPEDFQDDEADDDEDDEDDEDEDDGDDEDDEDAGGVEARDFLHGRPTWIHRSPTYRERRTL